MKLNNFKELQIWQESIELAEQIYKITNNQSFNKDFGLRDQLRRAVVSISSNTVEGFERDNSGDFIRFLAYTKGSVGEIRNQICIAQKVKYITLKQYMILEIKSADLSKQITKFRNYLITYKESNKTNNL